MTTPSFSTLLKYIKQVDLFFSPISKTSVPTRLFLSRIVTNRAKKLSTLTVNVHSLSTTPSPYIIVEYVDGKKLNVHPENMSPEAIVQLVNKHAKRLNEEDIL